MILHQGVEGILVDMRHEAIVLLVVDLEEVARQLRDVIAAGPQRRQIDRDHVESVVEVFTKPLAGNFIEQLAVAGGDHAGVDANRLGVTHPFKLPLLEHPQKFDLQLGRGGVDFVEEDRAGVSGFKASSPVGHRAGKRAADMAEELALQQAL